MADNHHYLAAFWSGSNKLSSVLFLDPNKNTLSEENASEQIDRALSTQAKLVLIVAVPLTFALLFVVVVFACTYNLNHSQGQSRQRQSLQRTCPHPDKDYQDKLQKNISYHHNFMRTSGSSPYLGPEPSESEHSALTCSHSNLPSGGYKTSSDKVFGRYVDMPFHPPSLYSDTTLNSQRSLSNGRVLSLSNQHHLVTCWFCEFGNDWRKGEDEVTAPRFSLGGRRHEDQEQHVTSSGWMRFVISLALYNCHMCATAVILYETSHCDSELGLILTCIQKCKHSLICFSKTRFPFIVNSRCKWSP